IARIEIIRGPGSAVFGADAFAGVINIMTKTKEDIEGTETGFRIGRFDTQNAWLLHGSSWRDFDMALTLEYHQTDGHQELIDIDAQTYYDNFFGTDASLAPGPINLQRRNLDARLDISKENWQFRAGYQGRDNFGTGTGGAQALDPQGRFVNNRLNADLTYHNAQLIDNWDLTAQIAHFKSSYRPTRDIILFPPGAFGGLYPEGFIGNPGVSERQTRFSLSGFYTGFEKHMIRFGTGYYYGDLYDVVHFANYGINPKTGVMLPPGSRLVDLSDTPYAFLPEKIRKNWYLFLQDAWRFAAGWELTAGVRYDNYSDFGSTLNPRLALVWQTRPNLTTKLLYGHAFRAPSFQELYNINNPVALGNAHLEPETIETGELAFDYQVPTRDLRFALNLFTYKWSDAILFSPNPAGTTFVAQNVGSQKGHGLELEAKWKISPKINLSGNYAFQNSTDEETDHDAGNAPHHSAYLRTDWLFLPQWLFNAQLNWIADRQRVYSDPRAPIDDYTTLDLTLRRQDIKQHWDLAVSVRNVLDNEVREPSPGPDVEGIIGIPHDIPSAGRHYFIELRYHF
ncbi:MAG: TonB-dependent receptor, partial [Pseudomonadota bacterium]|nr:TonB-dependent receptor [Pseudomonadota bacterium]